MRNWNPKNISLYACFLFNFDSTYEELKLLWRKLGAKVLLSILTLPMRNWNNIRTVQKTRQIRDFDSTYEELKPNLQVIAKLRDWHFDSTYEELKQDKSKEEIDAG